MTRVMGIDPGIAATGYGVVERRGGSLRPVASGVVRTPGGAPQALRLARLYHDVLRLFVRHRPDAAAVERLYFNVNVKTAMAVAQAAGVALAAAAEAGVEVFDYSPQEIKQAVVGVGGASKRQVQAMVRNVLHLVESPPRADAADACALAICHLNRAGYTRAVERARARTKQAGAL